MIDKDWRSLPESVRSSEWWKMFENSVNDGRRLLTWEDRFSGIQRAVNCYSETEDTLGNADENAWMITHLRRENYWAMQELNKGTILTSVLPDNIMNCEGGWGFNPVYDRYRRRLAIGSQGNVFRKSFNEVLENLSRKDMIEKPLFRPFDDRLLFTTNTVYPNVVRLVRSRILADGIPAKTFAAGANPIGNGKVSDNMNYANCKIQSIGWPRKDDRWRHSDIKNVAFIFNHVFFKKLVNGETK